VEGMARGRSGDSLERWIRAVARQELLPHDDVGELTRLLAELRASEPWARLMASGSALVELGVMRATPTGDRVDVVEGVIDAAVRSEAGWSVLDWKTDAAAGAAWEARLRQYEGQVGAHASVLTALTGAPATGEVVRLATSGGVA